MNRQLRRHALVFSVAQHRYAVPSERVHQIVHMAALVSTPGQPSVIEGFLNLRGRAIPVIRLRRLFQLDARAPQIYTPLVIVDSGGLAMALAVDAVEEVADFDDSSIQPLSEGNSPNNCAEAVFNLDGRQVILLSCDLLLLAKERACLTELQAAVDERLGELGPVAG